MLLLQEPTLSVQPRERGRCRICSVCTSSRGFLTTEDAHTHDSLSTGGLKTDSVKIPEKFQRNTLGSAAACKSTWKLVLMLPAKPAPD